MVEKASQETKKRQANTPEQSFCSGVFFSLCPAVGKLGSLRTWPTEKVIGRARTGRRPETKRFEKEGRRAGMGKCSGGVVEGGG